MIATSENELRSIPLSVPQLSGRELEYLEQCIHTGWVSSVGKYVEEFESTVAEYVGRKYGVATMNGTAALHLALQVSGVGRGDEVIVPALSFVAPANAARYLGASPVFIDVEPEYWQLDVNLVEQYLQDTCRFGRDGTFNKTTNKKVSAIVAVHLLGQPVDMSPLMALAKKYKIVVVEDAAESLGASYQGIKTGGIGDIACFSFNGNKIVTSGGGGVLVTQNRAWAERARHLSTQAKSDAVEYVHDEVGYNYRLTNIQAALGCAQMEQLEEFVKAKRRIAATYNSVFLQVKGLEPMQERPGTECTFWLYTLLFDDDKVINSRKMMHHLQQYQIQSRPLWQPLPDNPLNIDTAESGGWPVARRLYKQALSIPSSTSLTKQDQETVISRVMGGL